MNSRQAIWTTVVSVMALLGLQSTTTVGAVPGQAAGPATGLWAGVYTTEQAVQGESTFVSLCSRCHNPDLSGGQVGASYAPPWAANGS